MKLKTLLYSALALATVGITSCSPDEYELSSVPFTSANLCEDIAFSITHDSENPNIVYLKSLLSSEYTALWEHPQGRSQASEVTLKIPFAGTYSVLFGVMTGGGVVYSDTAYFTISTFCSDFVDNVMWTNLSGGVGNSKKWFLDLDKNGVSRYFSGPMYFYGTDDCWETVTDGESIDGDSWNWSADWGSIAGWGFTSTAMDFGYMQFDLDGGSNVTVVMNDLDRTMTGTYLIDTDNHTLTLTDAELLHESYYDGAVEAWSGKLKILSLTETTMQIGVLRSDDPCLLSYNFISEDYYNNWTEDEAVTDVTPELASDWRDYVEPKTNLVITYVFAVDDTPFDWCNLDGSLKGVGSSYSAYDELEDFTFEMNSGAGTYSITDADGVTYSGTYTLTDEGVYDFSDALPEISLSGDVDVLFGGTSTLRIMQYEVDSYSGGLTDLWLGAEEYDDFGNLYQYVAYHFQPKSSSDASVRFEASMNYFDTGWSFQSSETVYITGDGSYTFTIEGSYSSDGSTSPYGIYLDVLKMLKKYPECDVEVTDIKIDGTSISFDDSLIDRTTGDDSATARRYILNPWGATADQADNFRFSSSVSVTVYVKLENGTSFIAENTEE